MKVDVVVPSAGRPSLARLLASLGAARGPAPARVIVVDDRRARGAELFPGAGAPALAVPVEIVPGPGTGPAAARNAGWRRATAPWVAFLDDDVEVGGDWLAALARDLDACPAEVVGVQGRVVVPRPAGRRPTDWERNVGGLQDAAWATADMAYRRSALVALGGFDERFSRPYREDADLALRALRAGSGLRRGTRRVCHPVGAAGWWTSVRLQAGNADDVLMRALHGAGWRREAGAPRGRLPVHLAVTAAGATVLGAIALGRRGLARAAAGAWAAGSAELAWRRIAPGPRDATEVARMVTTSIALPPAAVLAWARGHVRRRALVADRERAPAPAPAAASPAGSERPGRGFESCPPPARRPEAVLLDRDGTLVVDIPYNGDPARVEPVPGATEALARLRGAGIRLAVVSNQSGVGRGLLSAAQVQAVNQRMEELLGPLGPVLVCPHAPGEGCTCRKPRPGLVLQAAERLGVAPERCAVIGDIGADVEAARAAGARGVLIPTPVTKQEEIRAAREVVSDLGAAVDLLLSGRR